MREDLFPDPTIDALLLWSLSAQGIPSTAPKDGDPMTCPRCGVVTMALPWPKHATRYCSDVCRKGRLEDQKAEAKAVRLSRYGLNEEDYQRLRSEQNDTCAICHHRTGRDFHGLAIDHDHATGRVRGLLCGDCNRGLGWFRDDPDRLAAGAAYLRRQTALGLG